MLNEMNSDVDSAGGYLDSDVQDQYDNYDSDLNVVKNKNTFKAPSNIDRHLNTTNAQMLKDFYREYCEAINSNKSRNP